MPEVATPLLCSVTVDQYEELSSSEEPFLCFTCCRTQHQQQITELRSEVEALKFEISQLKAQLQPPRPQILSNEVVEHYPPPSAEREATPENGSWQPVGKKRRPRKQQGSKQGAAKSTETSEHVSKPKLQLQHAVVKNGPRVRVEGARRVWGTMKHTTTKTIKNAISRFCNIEGLSIRRKTRNNPSTQKESCMVVCNSC